MVDYAEEKSEALDEPEETSDEYGEDFGEAIREAFPDNKWTPDRLAAMKEAIRLCVEKDTAPPPKPGSLALIFGNGGKKKG